MSNLTNTAETYTADWLAGNPTTAPVTPFFVALVTAEGDDTVQGTEVAGNGYARQQLDFGAAVGREVSNVNTIRFDLMPACTVVGFEIYDSSATPVRWFYGPLAVARQIEQNDPAEFVPGSLVLSTA